VSATRAGHTAAVAMNPARTAFAARRRWKSASSFVLRAVRLGAAGPSRCLPQVCFALALAVLVPARAATADPEGEAQRRAIDGSADVIVQRATVPRDGDAQGEVRLVRRGDAIVVQTVLESRVLRRVVREVGLKEKRDWPAGRAGHDQSRAYMAALEDAARAVAHDHARHDERRVHKQKLVIEHVRTDADAFVALYELPVGSLTDRTHLGSKKLVRVLDLSRVYIERDMVLIASDALGVDEAEAGRMIGLAPRAGASGSGEGGAAGVPLQR